MSPASQEIYEALDPQGQAAGLMEGNINFRDDSMRLHIADLEGVLKSSGTDYKSKYEIVLVRELMTEKAAQETDSLVSLGLFPNVLQYSAIEITGGQVYYSGIFEHLRAEGAIQEHRVADSIFVSIHVGNFQTILPDVLDSNESVAVVSRIDGGFDVSSALLQARPSAGLVKAGSEASEEFSIHPNPATHTARLNFPKGCDLSHLDVHVFNALGQEVYSFSNFGQNAAQGSQFFDVPVRDFAPGIYWVEATVEGTRKYRSRLVVQH